MASSWDPGEASSVQERMEEKISCQSPKQQSYSISNICLMTVKSFLKWQRHHYKLSPVLPSWKLFLLCIQFAQERLETGRSFPHHASLSALRVLSFYTSISALSSLWTTSLLHHRPNSLDNLRERRRCCHWRNCMESNEIWWWIIYGGVSNTGMWFSSPEWASP